MGQFYEQNQEKIKRLKEKKEGAKLRKIADEGAKLGDAECVELIGEDFYYGRSVTTDYAKSFYYFSKAAEGDSAMAWYHLGLSYWFAEGVKRDPYQALKYMRKAMGTRYIPALYFGIAMTALFAKEDPSNGSVDDAMQSLYELYQDTKFEEPGFAYAVYLIQGEAFPDVFEPCKVGVPDEKKKEGMRILEEIASSKAGMGYSNYYLSLIYAGGMPPVASENRKKAYKYLSAAAELECFPAAHTKSEMHKGKRDTKIIYFYKGGDIAVGNLYGMADDALDKLSLIIANNNVHEFDRDMMWLHGYAQFEVDMDARITAMYDRDPNAVILTKGPTMKKHVNGTPQPLYEAPVYDPDNPVSINSDAPSNTVSCTPGEGAAPSAASQLSSIAGSLADAAKNVDLNAAAAAAGDAVNKAAEKVKGLFGKFKK